MSEAYPGGQPAPGGVPAGSRLRRAGRRWLAARPLRRPRLLPRWIALAAGMAASALFLSLAGTRPALEHSRHHHAVQPGPLRAGGGAETTIGVPAPPPPAREHALGGLPPPPHAALPPPGARRSPHRPHRPARPAR